MKVHENFSYTGVGRFTRQRRLLWIIVNLPPEYSFLLPGLPIKGALDPGVPDTDLIQEPYSHVWPEGRKPSKIKFLLLQHLNGCHKNK